MIRKSVLIVDDEADIRELLVLTLTRMGVDADTAPSIKAAKEALQARPYDLCLTDMRLPDGDGLEVLKYIAENHGNTPVAVITAYGSTENAVQALKAGAFDYLAKPIKLEQLSTLVTSAFKLRFDAGAAPRSAGPRDSAAPGRVARVARARQMIDSLRSQAPVYRRRIGQRQGSGGAPHPQQLIARDTVHRGELQRDPRNLMETGSSAAWRARSPGRTATRSATCRRRKRERSSSTRWATSRSACR